jgi:hypothetical protein
LLESLDHFPEFQPRLGNEQAGVHALQNLSALLHGLFLIHLMAEAELQRSAAPFLGGILHAHADEPVGYGYVGALLEPRVLILFRHVVTSPLEMLCSIPSFVSTPQSATFLADSFPDSNVV